MKLQSHDIGELETAINDVRAASAITYYMIAGIEQGGAHDFNDDALYLLSMRLHDAVPVLVDVLETLYADGCASAQGEASA